VNEVYIKKNAETQKARESGGITVSGGGLCAKCGNKLSGEALEVGGSHYHVGCFGCADCGKKLSSTCLNIGGKPYCDGCGKKAFIKSTLAKRQNS